MKGSKLQILPVALLALLAASIISYAKGRWDDEATRRKAEYIFLESQNVIGQDMIDEYVALVDRAYDLDSADVDIAAEWGFVVINTEDHDSLRIARAYNYLKRRFLAEPDNYTMGMMFANFASQRFELDDMAMAWETLDSLFPQYDRPAQELARVYLMQYAFTGDSSKLSRVFDIYNRIESGSGKTLPLMAQKMRAYLIAKDTIGAERELEALTAGAPADSYVALFAGSNYQLLENYDKALEYYDRACLLDSTNGQAYMARANMYKERGDSVSFDREVFLALKSQSLEVEPKLEMLRSYVSMLYQDTLQEGRIRELFQTLEAQHAGEPEIHNLYAAYLYEIADYPGAIEQMEYSVSLNPNDQNAWSTLVQISGRAGDVAAIISHASEAMERYPDDLYFPIMAANGYFQEDQIPQALQVLESVKLPKDVNPELAAIAVSFKGDLLAREGDTLKALEAYDLAVAYDPTHIMSYNNAAYFMAENNMDLDKALQYIQKVMRIDDKNPTYIDTYAWVLFKRKEYVEAKKYIDLALEAYKNEMEGATSQTDGVDDIEDIAVQEPSAEIYEHAGDIYFMNGEPDIALDFWKKALAIDPDREILARKVKHKTYFFK